MGCSWQTEHLLEDQTTCWPRTLPWGLEPGRVQAELSSWLSWTLPLLHAPMPVTRFSLCSLPAHLCGHPSVSTGMWPRNPAHGCQPHLAAFGWPPPAMPHTLLPWAWVPDALSSICWGPLQSSAHLPVQGGLQQSRDQPEPCPRAWCRAVASPAQVVFELEGQTQGREPRGMLSRSLLPLGTWGGGRGLRGSFLVTQSWGPVGGHRRDHGLVSDLCGCSFCSESWDNDSTHLTG